MNVINTVKLTFPGISENERTARAVVSAFLVQLDPTVEELVDIRTAVSEAVTNAIVYGYRDTTGDVEYISSYCQIEKFICALRTRDVAWKM